MTAWETAKLAAAWPLNSASRKDSIMKRLIISLLLLLGTTALAEQRAVLRTHAFGME